MDQPWAFTLLIVAAPVAFTAVLPVVQGEAVNAAQIRRSYALAGIFTLGASVLVSVLAKDGKALLAGVAILGANVAAQEWALALRNVESGRPE